MIDTIVALSSGRPPAAIAVLRVSGPEAFAAVASLAGVLPAPRYASLRALRDRGGELLDRALVLVFPGPASATGEDLVELHCHGGRAIVAAVEAALIAHPDVRRAEPGEFTRRALINGRIDLAQAEGLADLLEAETEGQRRAALAASEGIVSSVIRDWLARLAMLSAQVEATLDYAEEGEVAAEAAMLDRVRADGQTLREEIERVLAAPPVERLRDGVRVVIGGPPNSGKSTLFNLMVDREAAIVSPFAGTTRDRIEAPVVRGGEAYLLSDTAGLTDADDPVERIGVARAEEAIGAAEILLWLGDYPPPRTDALWLHARADVAGREMLPAGRLLALSQSEPRSIQRLWEAVASRTSILLPGSGDLPLKAAQRSVCARAAGELTLTDDPLIAAEQLRIATRSLATILGLDATETMLNALFSRFCLGK